MLACPARKAQDRSTFSVPRLHPNGVKPRSMAHLQCMAWPHKQFLKSQHTRHLSAKSCDFVFQGFKHTRDSVCSLLDEAASAILEKGVS